MAALKNRSEAHIMSGSALQFWFAVIVVNRIGLSFQGMPLSLTQKWAALRRDPLLRGEMCFKQV